MEIVRPMSELVHPLLERKWFESYQQYAARHPEEELESAAAFADATWEGVTPPGKVIPDSPAARIGAVMLCEPKKVPAAAIDAVTTWERKAGRAAGPEEISAVLAGAGIDPLLSKAQRTIPGSGMLREVSVDPLAQPNQPPPKKRGRPPKVAGLAASAPAKPTAPAASDRETHVRKAAKKLDDVARNIAQFSLSEIPEMHRRRVVELALTHAKVYDQEKELRDAIEGDVH